MAKLKCILSVVMNSGVVYRVSFDDLETAKKTRDRWISAGETFDVTYSDGSIITVNQRFVESFNLTPVNSSHISTSLDTVMYELYNDYVEQMRINNVSSKLQDIKYSIDRLSDRLSR